VRSTARCSGNFNRCSEKGYSLKYEGTGLYVGLRRGYKAVVIACELDGFHWVYWRDFNHLQRDYYGLADVG